MKKYISGLLTGGILVFAFSVLAAELNVNPNPFPIIVNGIQASIEGYNIGGYTYLKLADVAKATNNTLGIKFDEVKEEIQISTEGNNTIKLIAPVAEEENMSSLKSTEPEYTFITIDSNEYIDLKVAQEFCGNAKPYMLAWNPISNNPDLHATLTNIPKMLKAEQSTDEALLNSGLMIYVPLVIINDKLYMTRETFENVVLPFMNM